MASCNKGSYHIRQEPEKEILPRLFTPNKARRAQNWLRSGNYSYDEKMAVLKTLWKKEEERQATDKVLKESFNPIVVPRVRVWLNEADAEEKTVIMKLFRSMTSTPEKITTNSSKLGRKAVLPGRNIATMTMTRTDRAVTKTWRPQRGTVNWADEYAKTKTHNPGGVMNMAKTRTEFDIAPDWRAPKRCVVPMTQIARRAQVQGGLSRLSKNNCLYDHNSREFVIHPEWIIR